MPESGKQIHLSDMIDIEFLQQFQDIFAKAMNVASITVDENGPITKPSNFTDFCIVYTRGSKEGYRRCNQCDIKWGKIAAERGEPVIYNCHSGLTDFAVPIMVSGVHIASILGGQVLTKEPDEEHFRELARELGINENEYIKAVRNIKVIPIERVKAAAQLLFIVANAMSKIANKTLDLVEQSHRENLQQSVIETIRSTLDIDEIKKNVVQGVGQILEAYRCFIINYDDEKNAFLPLDENSVYVSGPNVFNMVGFNPEDEVTGNVAKEFKELKKLAIIDVEASTKKKKLENPEAEVFCEKFHVKTAIRVPITYSDHFFGVLVIQYDEVKKGFDDTVLDFITSLASQVGIAMYQSWLYKKEKKTAESEALLRNITENIRSSLDVQETLFYICESTTKLFNVQRSAITEANVSEDDGGLIFRREYKADPSLQGITNAKNFPDIAAFWNKSLLKTGRVLAIDNIEKSDAPDFFKDTYRGMGVKSIIGTAIRKGDEVWGTLVLSEYNEYRHWSESEKTLLKAIASQIYIAINQAELFEAQKKATERETLLRTITETIRSTLDIEKVKKTIVKVVGETLNADRCFISEYDAINDKFEIVTDEYISSDDIPSYAGADPNKDVPLFMAAFKDGKNLLVQNKKIFIDSKLQQYEQEEFAIQKNKVHACFAVPLFHNKIFLGFLATHYVREHHIGEDEIQLMNTIANQVAIALHQAKVYKLTKLQAQKERLYRSITEKIRSTLDIDELFELICSELASIYNIQRAFIVKFKSHVSHADEIQIFKEFKSSPDIKGLQDDNFDVRTIEYWGKVLLKDGQKIIIDNISESDTPDYFKKTYEKIGAKSIMGSAIKKDNDNWGWVGVSEYNYYRHWSEDDVKLLETISDQIYIAIKQAELYNITKIKAQRERLIGIVLAKAISTFDINQIKQLVNEIGALTNADRCYFVEVDVDNFKGRPIYYEGEYLSSPDVKSIVGYKFPAEDVKKFVELYTDKRDLIIFDYEELSKNNEPQYAGINKYSSLFDLKSGIGIPFVYMNKLKAVLCIEYSKEKVLPTADELDFLRILGNQIGMTFNQIHNYEDLKKTAEKEQLLRKIFETMRLSLDINDVKQTIVKEVGEVLKADRCFIVEYDNKKDKYLLVNDEYLSSDKIISYKGVDVNIEVPSYAKVAKNGKALLVNNGEIQYQTGELGLQKGELEFEVEAKTLEKYQVNSLYNLPLFYRNEFLGCLSISYTRRHTITEEEIALINIVANQIAIALHQATLYQLTQMQVEKEKLIADILSKAISTFDITQIKPIVKEIGQLAKADRCYFVEVDLERMRGVPIDNDAEYLASPEISTAVGYPFCSEDVKRFIEIFLEERDLVFFDFEEMRKNKGEEFQGMNRYSSLFDLKSGIEIPFYSLGKLTGVLCIEYVKEKVIPTEEERDFLRILANQIGMTFNQIQNYQDLKKTADREGLLRKIYETMRSSLELNVVKNKIVTEVGEALNADMCFILGYDEENDTFSIGESSEYKAEPEHKTFINYNVKDGNVAFFMNAFKAKQELNYVDVNDFIASNRLEGSPEETFLREYKIKSSYNFPIMYADKLLGYLILQYVTNNRELDNDELDLLRTIAVQAGIAVYQAKLYKITKLQAEREKISRNLIEILRNTLDKSTIKRLFVKNIGQYFHADRVFFSEYDSASDMYLPVDNNSEYLSSPDERSFVGYDWSDPQNREYIAPLLDRKELNIFDWDEYIKSNYRSADFTSLFEASHVKSSYNLPVLYQQSIIGYFCIEFTHKVFRMPEEDISLIRSICRQAGIALYHAELYEKAQEASRSKDEVVRNIALEIRTKLNEIIKIPEVLSTFELTCDNQSDYLESLNEGIKEILERIDKII